MTPDRPDPILRAPPRIVARGGAWVRGHGVVTARLASGADVVVRVRADVAYAWSGTGSVRMPQPDVRRFTGAVGTLEVRGEGVDVEALRGDVELVLVGTFDVTLGARAELVGSDGTRCPGRGAGRRLRVTGSTVVDAEGRAGGAAA
jgi:hypothetical protein